MTAIDKAIDKVIKVAENEIDYLEKQTNNNLYDKTTNAGYNNYTKYWDKIAPNFQGQPWCAGFVTDCYTEAYGKDNAKKLLKHYPYTYCPTMASLFKLNANPKRGDIVIFKRNGEFVHTGIVTYVDGDYFETIEGNTSDGHAIVDNGGAVCKKSYYNSNLPGTKFCTPDYSIVEYMFENNEEDIDMDELRALEERVNELDNKINNPMIYNYIDGNMPSWSHEAVQWCVDKGIIQGTRDGLGLNDIKLWTCVVMYRLASNL